MTPNTRIRVARVLAAAAGCTALLQCSRSITDVSAQRNLRVAPGLSSFEAEPTTQDQANACLSVATGSIAVRTGAVSATTGSTCTFLERWGASANVYVDERRDVSPNGTFVEQTGVTGTGWLLGDCSTSDTTQNPYTCNKTFQALNCTEPGDVEGGRAVIEHQVQFLHFVGVGGKETSHLDSCLGNSPTLSFASQIMIGGSTQATTNCGNAAHTSWLSSDPSVASVSTTGGIIGSASGVATITVECWTSENHSDITVVERDLEGGSPGGGNAIINDCQYYVYELSLDGGATWGEISAPFWSCP